MSAVLCWLADTSEAVQNTVSNGDSDWKQSLCADVAVSPDGVDVEDKLDNSMYDASEPADEGTGGWAENIASGGCEAGASGWLDNGVKNVDTNGDEWIDTTDRLLSADRHAHRFTASVVVDTGNKERRKFVINWCYILRF